MSPEGPGLETHLECVQRREEPDRMDTAQPPPTLRWGRPHRGLLTCCSDGRTDVHVPARPRGALGKGALATDEDAHLHGPELSCHQSCDTPASSSPFCPGQSVSGGRGYKSAPLVS